MEDTHYTNDFLDAFQSCLDTTEINLCDISIKEALQRAFEAGHDYCAEHNRYLKEALIVEQQKVNKMKVCGNCVHIRECDRHEHTHIRICDDWQYNEYCQEKPMFR